MEDILSYLNIAKPVQKLPFFLEQNMSLEFSTLEIWFMVFRKIHNLTIHVFKEAYGHMTLQSFIAFFNNQKFDDSFLRPILKEFVKNIKETRVFDTPPFEIVKAGYMSAIHQIRENLKSVISGKFSELKFYYQAYNSLHEFSIEPLNWEISDFEGASEKPIEKEKYAIHFENGIEKRIKKLIPCSKFFMELSNFETLEPEEYAFYLEGTLDEMFNEDSVPRLLLHFNYAQKEMSISFKTHTA